MFEKLAKTEKFTSIGNVDASAIVAPLSQLDFVQLLRLLHRLLDPIRHAHVDVLKCEFKLFV